MTVSTTTTYNEAAAGATVYYFTFRADATSWVKTYVAGLLTTLGITVALNSDQDASPGGTVTFNSAATGIVRIERETPLTQDVSYTDYDAFPANTHERALDKLTLALQDAGRSNADDVAAEAALRSAADAAETSARVAADAAILAGAVSPLTAVGPAGVIATGATAVRTVSDRFADVVNVLNFGAVADGARPWVGSWPFGLGSECYANGNVYVATVGGTTGGAAPSGTGTVADGGVTWTFDRVATDNLAAFQDALDELPDGGTLKIPRGAFVYSGSLTIPTSTVISGDSRGASIVVQAGAAFALAPTDGFTVRDLYIMGGPLATGGIDVSHCGWGRIRNVQIENFKASGAIALNVHESYRVVCDGVYIYSAETGLKFSGMVTTFGMSNSNVSRCSSRAIDASTGSSDFIDAYFYKTYFESNDGMSPIYANQSGRLSFARCGFEDMCSTNGASPRVLWAASPTFLILDDCQFSGFLNTHTYTGTASFIHLAGPGAVVHNCEFVQNFAISGYTLRVVTGTLGASVLSMRNNRLKSSVIATELEFERVFVTGLDPGYPPTSFEMSGNRAGATFLQKETVTASLTAVATGTGASTTLFSRVFPSSSFGPGSAIKLTAWGRRAGTAGTKQIKLSLSDGSALVLPATAAVTAADSWKVDAVIQFHGSTDQSISIIGHDGAATQTVSSRASEDSQANDITLALIGECASGGDSITLDGLLVTRS